ncbi:MAG: OmpA family protein [candidate division Zixibacteria bacterium]|nr:OmpA family protein [candidate division Zixibacteria bacterium]MDH3937984.1 OmpA family protein [candidate division Zixibacteria bacterium]MDH4033158.1 OmpA family protein [candidate division Zixibacteria bacterium]
MPRLRRKKSSDDQENHERWLLTYADMITLLLALFIVMYSMSQIDAKRFGKMAEALNGILKGGQTIINQSGEDQFKTGHGVLKLGDLRMIQRQVEEQTEVKGRSEEVLTEITERGLVVHIVESAVFQPGSADLQPAAMQLLDLVYETIRGTPNHIRVEGHTDDAQIKSTRYPSNWELSAARATEVVRYFVSNYNIDEGRISALGYGEFRPIRPNNSIENRALNRRVDIVVLTRELSQKEPSSQLYGEADQ